MRIVHILAGSPTREDSPHALNGVNRVVHGLANAQARLGHDVSVWGIIPTDEVGPPDREYELRVFRKRPFRFSLPGGLTKALRDLPNTTVLHLHSVFVPEFVPLSRILVARRMHWVLTPHGGYNALSLVTKRRVAKAIYIGAFERLVARRASAIHAIGMSEVGDILQVIPCKRVVRIPNGTEFYESASPEKSLNKVSEPIFGYCGRLDLLTKGLDLLIQGFSIYRKNGGKGMLWVVGDGPDRNKIDALVKNSFCPEAVICWGMKFGAEKRSLVANFDASVHPSRWDVMPTAALEAAGLGVPLIVSEATNLAEYVRAWKCGLVLEASSAEAISKAFLEISLRYEKNLLVENRHASRKMALAVFDWSHIARRIEFELYACGTCGI